MLGCAGSGAGDPSSLSIWITTDGGKNAVEPDAGETADSAAAADTAAPQDSAASSDSTATIGDAATSVPPDAGPTGPVDASASGGGYDAYIAKYASAGAQYFVSPSGSDSNPGTSSASPWATIAHADSAAPACSVIWFEPGTYTMTGGSEGVHTTSSGTSSCHKAYVSTTYGGAQLRWTGAGNADPTWWEDRKYVDHVGFDISSPGGCDAYFGGGNNIYAYNRVHDVDVAGVADPSWCGNGTGGGGIAMGIGNGGNTIYANVIWNIGQSGGKWIHGIYSAGSGDVVQNNVVYSASGACWQGYHEDTNVVLTNNTFSDCQSFGIVFGGDSCGATAGANLFIANNIVANSPASAGAIASCCGSGTTSQITMTNNLLNGDATGVNTGACGADGTPQPTATVASSPGFVNYASPAAGGDFHLKPGSSAIGAGTPTNAPSLDLDGKARKSPPSIGAYE
jgi:hypothetical protein